MGMDMESGKTQPKVLAMIIQGLFPWFAALGSGDPDCPHLLLLA